jgi:hypothetical protein
MTTIYEPPAGVRMPCDLAEHFGTPCSEPATPAKHDLHLCDRHEIERRGEACGISPQQWLHNVGNEHLIPQLFPESA